MIIFIDQFQSELSVSAILSCEETNISLEFKDRWSKVFREEVKIIKDNWIAILLSNIFYFHFQKKIQFYYKYKILPLEIQKIFIE